MLVVIPLSSVGDSGSSGILRNSNTNNQPATVTVGALNTSTTFGGSIADNTASLALAVKAFDILVVTVTPDRYVNKGPHRPVFSEELRAEAIAALQCVDYVAINEWPTAVETIKHREE